MRAAVVSVAIIALSACNDTTSFAPDRPDSPWRPDARTGLVIPSGARGFVAPRERKISVEYDHAIAESGMPGSLPGHDGTPSAPLRLIDLIDLAERHNPQTRLSWERARQAAIGIGLSQAALLPQVTFSALGGFKRSVFPLPNYIAKDGYITNNAVAFFPELQVQYLLFDFGQVRAQVSEAQQNAMAADFGFTADHQALILAVVRAYYAYGASQATTRAAQTAVENTAVVLRAARARRTNGEATITEVTIAERNAAQARYESDKAIGAEHAAKHALLAAMGLSATTDLAIAGPGAHFLPPTLPTGVQSLIDQALSGRPDILADLARLRAADASIVAAKASLAPKISLSLTMDGYIGEQKTYRTSPTAPASRVAQPQGTAGFQINWPIYQGGLRRNEILMAESRRAQAAASLSAHIVTVEREVADAQDELATALSETKSAQVLRDSAQVAFRDASQSYAHGVGTLTDASNAVAALAQAEAALASSQAQAYSNAATLAHATGQLFSSENAVPAADATGDEEERAP